jgi:DNA-binding beta-propeller fold protein YncE
MENKNPKRQIRQANLLFLQGMVLLLWAAHATFGASAKTLLASGLNAPVGVAYNESKNILYFVEYNPAAKGTLKCMSLPPQCSVCDTSAVTIAGGFSHPEDVQVDVSHGLAYITTRDDAGTTGALWKVNLATRVKSMVTFNLGGPQQLFLDIANNQAYTVGYNDGKLRRIDLATGAKTPVAAGLGHPVGLAITKDRKYAYVTDQDAPAKILKIDLTSGANLGAVIKHGVAGTSLVEPFFLAWTDESQNSLYVTERGTANRVSRVEILTQSKYQILVDAGAPPVWWRWPSGIAIGGLGTCAYISTNTAIVKADLMDFADLLKEPIFVSVGHVPSTKIVDGYATTDPGYSYQVKHSPFGGTLNIFGNLSKFKAAPLNAVYYQVKVSQDGGAFNPLNLGWNAYKYDTVAGEYKLVAVAPDGAAPKPAEGPKYRIPDEYPLNAARWVPSFLMIRWPSGENGLYTFKVKIFSATGDSIAFPPAWNNSLVVLIDNTPPDVKITGIWQKRCGGAADNEIIPCEIVSTPLDKFYFKIIADDPNQHLLSYALTALWGDNQSALVYSDNYSQHVVNALPHAWSGVVNLDVPRSTVGSGGTLAPWIAQAKCAHTFYLGSWKRTIDGENYLLYRDYHKSITINTLDTICH